MNVVSDRCELAGRGMRGRQGWVRQPFVSPSAFHHASASPILGGCVALWAGDKQFDKRKKRNLELSYWWDVIQSFRKWPPADRLIVYFNNKTATWERSKTESYVFSIFSSRDVFLTPTVKLREELVDITKPDVRYRHWSTSASSLLLWSRLASALNKVERWRHKYVTVCSTAPFNRQRISGWRAP
jgi:hypothetical protein